MDRQRKMKRYRMKSEKKERRLVHDLPLFSVIVLTYMQRHLLEDCIKSILGQTYPNLELVICDDSSADFDADEVRDYIERRKKENIKRVIVFKQPKNIGTVQNAQKGVSLSSGEYFKLHAGDDMLEEDSVLEKVMSVFLNADTDTEIGIVAGRSIACQPDKTMTNDYYPSTEAVVSMIEADARKQFELIGTQAWGEFVNAPAVFWKRALFDRVGGFDTSYKYTEDWPMWLKLTGMGCRIHMIDQVTTIYRYGGISNDASSMNLTLGKAHYQECIRMFQEQMIPVFEAEGNYKKVFRCKHCIRCLEIRRDTESCWAAWNNFDRLGWRIRNCGFLMTSWLYRRRKNGILFNKRRTVKVMGVCALMSMFHVEAFPGVLGESFWAWLFCGAFLWLSAKIVVENGIWAVNRFLNRRKGSE